MSQKTKARWKIIVTILTFIALGGTIYALRQQIVDSFQNLWRINAWVLLLLPFWQLINYYSYTQQARALFLTLGEKIRPRSLFRVMLELNFVNNVFPSGGVSGLSYFTLRMKDAQVSTAMASLVYLLRFILVFISFQILMFIGLVLLAVEGRANSFVLLIGGSVATLVLVGTMVIAYVIGSKARIRSFFVFLTRIINRIIHVVRRKNPETINIGRAEGAFVELHENYMKIKTNFGSLKRPLFWSLVANMSEVLTIYTVYVAFGQWVNPGAVILAYAVANFAGFISVLPGGVGVYEVLMTGVLTASGIPASLSLPVTVMYRILNMSIQLPPGWFFYYKKIHGPDPSKS